MIGIAMKLYDVFVISEFFELFKTPWEPLKRGRVYDVVICDQIESNFLQAQLVIVMHRRGGLAIEDRGGNLNEPILVRNGNTTFPVYAGVETIGGGSTLIEIEETGKCVGSRCEHKETTILHLGYNFFEECAYQLTYGQPLKYAGFPTLDIHIANLRAWILAAGLPLVEIPPVASDSKFFACLTHDVDFAGIRNHKFDRTIAGFVYRALVTSVVHYVSRRYSLRMLARNWIAVFKLPLIHMGLTKDFWSTFRQYRAIEGRAQSTFFLVPFKNTPGISESGSTPSIRAVKYDLENLRTEMLYLIAQGCEIGVHGIDSWIDVEKARQEISRIQSLIGQSPKGVRMHWLYFGPESPEKLERAGYSYDSTSGYNEEIGYRAGTAQVYRPPRAKHLLELPMHIMDTALFYPTRMNLSLSEGITEVKSFIDTAEQFGGLLTFNWHDRSVAPERLWDGVYRSALNQLQRQGAKFMTAGAAVAWFKKRRTVVFDQVHTNSTSIKVKLTGLHVTAADGMLLRIYPPSKRSPLEKPGTSTTAIYEEYLLADQKEIEFFL